jgi:hypothetical protein
LWRLLQTTEEKMNTENKDDHDFYSKLEEFGLIKTSKLTHDGSNVYVKKGLKSVLLIRFRSVQNLLK